MGVKLVSSSAGSVELVAPVTASNYTATMPAKTGTVMLDGPAFSAYNSSTQSVSNATVTKLVCNTETFDTASCFDSTTNYRFTPTVAGYYQINVSGYGYPSASGVVSMQIWKNGATSLVKTEVVNSNTGPQLSCSTVLYLNGSTDYVEFYTYQNSGGSLNMSAQNFSGALVRGA